MHLPVTRGLAYEGAVHDALPRSLAAAQGFACRQKSRGRMQDGPSNAQVPSGYPPVIAASWACGRRTDACRWWDAGRWASLSTQAAGSQRSADD